VHGDRDTLTPLAGAQRYCERLRERGCFWIRIEAGLLVHEIAREEVANTGVDVELARGHAPTASQSTAHFSERTASGDGSVEHIVALFEAPVRRLVTSGTNEMEENTACIGLAGIGPAASRSITVNPRCPQQLLSDRGFQPTAPDAIVCRRG
jgi:hypothetical protein